MNSGTLARLIVVALVFLLLPALPALAHEIVVDAAGTCSFPDAFASANLDENRGGCTRVDDGNGSNDTIILEKDVSGGGLVMPAAATQNKGNITIEGKGHTYTMTVNHGRHFLVELNRLTINNLILTRAENTGRAGLGGSINVTGTQTNPSSLVVNDSVFHGNLAWNEGAAINLGPHKEATINRSVFYNNRSDETGSAIALQNQAHLIVNNSSFYNNHGKGVITPHDGTGGHPAEITLRHVTMFSNTGSGGGLRVPATLQSKLEMSNSIDVSNAGGACQLTGTLPTDTTLRNNIVGDGSTQNCKDGANTQVVDPMLPNAAGVTTLLHLIPLAGSPAIDAISAADCEAVFGTADSRDVLGTARPQNGKCDIGAYEVEPSRMPDTDGGGPVSAETAAARAASAAAAQAVSTCLTLNGVQVTGLSESTQCQRVNAVQIANPDIQEGDFVDAVDVWSWVLPNTQICFEAAGGVIKFIDTASMPRTIHDLEAYSLNGLPCAAIDGPGIVILMPGDPPPARAGAASGSASTAATGQSLSGCMVRATASLNLRASPGGAVIGGVGETWLLTAVERTAGWFRVDRLGEYGWISADYVETEGTCG